MFEEIDIEQLKKTKSFVELSKLHTKKVAKMQSEAEKVFILNVILKSHFFVLCCFCCFYGKQNAG